MGVGEEMKGKCKGKCCVQQACEPSGMRRYSSTHRSASKVSSILRQYLQPTGLEEDFDHRMVAKSRFYMIHLTMIPTQRSCIIAHSPQPTAHSPQPTAYKPPSTGLPLG